LADLEFTRGQAVGSGDMLPQDVKRICITSLGDDPISQTACDEIIRSLQASGRLAVADHPENADATLVCAMVDQTGHWMTLRLVNGSGKILWTATGSVNQVVAELLTQLPTTRTAPNNTDAHTPV
jgi:hypothetical protein